MFLMLTRRKTNPFYLADKVTCVACGRCYNHCPQGAPKQEPKPFDTVLGHVRLRKQTEKAPEVVAEEPLKLVKKVDLVKLASILNRVAVVIEGALILVTVTLVVNDRLIHFSEPNEQPVLERLAVALKMTPESEEIRESFNELNSSMQTRHFESTNRNEPFMIIWTILVVALAGVLKYRHNKCVVPAMKPSVNRDKITMVSVLLARIGVLALGAGLMVLALKLGTQIPQ